MSRLCYLFSTPSHERGPKTTTFEQPARDIIRSVPRIKGQLHEQRADSRRTRRSSSEEEKAFGASQGAMVRYINNTQNREREIAFAFHGYCSSMAKGIWRAKTTSHPVQRPRLPGMESGTCLPYTSTKHFCSGQVCFIPTFYSTRRAYHGSCGDAAMVGQCEVLLWTFELTALC